MKMKYLFFILIFIIFVLLFFILLPLISNLGKPRVAPTPLPVLTAPSGAPATTPTTTTPKHTAAPASPATQAQADQDFAAKIKANNDLYPWLNKLPFQTKNYYVYFDVDQKQFITKLYPQSSSTTSVDQQVADLKTEIITRLQSTIPNYTQYNIQWEVKPIK